MTRFHKKLDSTWRLVQRGVPQMIHPDVDGKDCYVFQRLGGDKPCDLISTELITVEQFWKV